jgi:type I restriction enzyme S subunit
MTARSPGTTERFRRYERYKNSGVEWLGFVPEHWPLERISQLATPSSGGTPSKEDVGFWNGEIPWVSPKDMKRRFIAQSEDAVTERAVRETGLKLLQPPQVLIVVRGMILAHSFPVAITTAPVTINQDMKALRLSERVDPHFLAYWLEGVAHGVLATLVDEAGHGTQVIRMDRGGR